MAVGVWMIVHGVSLVNAGADVAYLLAGGLLAAAMAVAVVSVSRRRPARR